MNDDRLQHLVTPFYLKMMRLNSLANGPELLPALLKMGRGVDPIEVIELLRDHWRPRVMGAWFSLMQDDVDVADAVLDALATSLGSLDSPPLIVVAVVLHGDRALAAIEAYIVRDVGQGWGACGFAAAATEHLGATARNCVATESDTEDFALMLDFAIRIRTA